MKGEDLSEVLQQVEDGVKDIFESGRYRTYLDTLAKFYQYSPANCLLIAVQKPDAEYVAGYRAWQKNFNRQVRKGEKGIRIIQPVPYKYEKEYVVKDADGNEAKEQRLVAGMGFKVGTVFDISQTDGEPLPEIAETLQGTVEDYRLYMDAIERVAGVPVHEVDGLSRANGYYSESEGIIAIKEDNPELQKLKTGFHELAHSILHNSNAETSKVDRATKEVQAESVAYVVMRHFGFDAGDYSFGYVAGWGSGRDTPELKQSLQVIQTAASKIITRMEETLSLIRTEKMEKTLKPSMVMSQ